MSETAASPSPRWYRLAAADLVFLVCVLAILPQARLGMLDDPGLGWHLRNIDAMCAEGGWLTHDPFSGPRGGQPYYTNQWLGDLLFWLGDRWAGLDGIAAVTVLTLALLFRCLFGMLLADGLAWLPAAVWTFLAMLGTSPSWPARPNIFTLLFLLLTVRLCVQFHRGRCTWRRLLWLWPLFIVWANTHGGFISGLISLGVATSVEGALGVGALTAEVRQAARRRCFTLTLLSAGAFLGTLVNPYGWRLYPWIFQLLGDPFFMNLNIEWLSPNFHLPGAFRYELLMLLFPALLAVSRRRPDLVSLSLAVVWLHFALNGGRYVALWVVVVVPLLAEASVDIPWLRTQIGRLPFSREMWRLLGPLPTPAPFLGSAVIAAGLLLWARSNGGYAEHQPENIPVAALQRLLELHDDEVVFNEYAWGGYLLWHGWPRFHTWMDDRNEVQGQAHTQQYLSLLQTEPGWEQQLQQAGIGLVCIRTQTPLAYRLAESVQWQEVYRDPYAVIFRRNPQ
jgi:hypothetical protein